MSSSTSLLGKPPEVTAPIRLEGESDSDMLFKWMAVRHLLWMLDPPYDDELRRIVNIGVLLELVYKLENWRRTQPHQAEGHAALIAPEVPESRQTAFARLERLMNAHFFDLGESGNG